MQEISEIVESTEKLASEGKAEQALEIFLDAIDRYKLINEEQADEAAFQMGWFLFRQYCYPESLETWKRLQEKGYRREEISQIIEEAFILPNKKEFQKIYEENLETYQTQIHVKKIYGYEELPCWFIPAANGMYYSYEKGSRRIGEKVIAGKQEYLDDEIFNGENAFDAIIFWKEWNYADPIKAKQRNNKRMVCFLSEGVIPFSYLQLPEFRELFREEWHIFDSIEDMKGFFHEHRELSLPRLYKGIQKDAELFGEWIGIEHSFRCSKDGRDGKNILLTIGIPSYNRGHRALENINHLQKLPYDSEIEFLVCDNCSQMNVEGYQEIEKLAESDGRITYYRFPDNPGGNISFAEAVDRASGKFCCMLSDEDLIYPDNVWKYLYLIQRYGENLGFIKAAGQGYYKRNVNRWHEKGDLAFAEVFWTLNYLSGLIFEANIHRKLKLREVYEWPTEPEDGNFFAKSYPHNVAAMRCALEENIYTCREILFQEGKDEFAKICDDSGKQKILDYARVEIRLKQLKGIIALLNRWKDMMSPEIMKNSYMRAVKKVFMLIDLIQRQGGIVECSFCDAYNRILRVSIEEIQRLDIDIEDKEYADMITMFSYWRAEYSKECAKEE